MTDTRGDEPAEAGLAADPGDANADVPAPVHTITVVGVGASAGGLEALEDLLLNMPTTTGLAFVIILHQQKGYKSLLSDLLGKKTNMPVCEVRESTPLLPNHVYTCPPGEKMAVINGSLQVIQLSAEQSVQLPVDYFFRSLAQDLGERAIGIILSGTGSDGSLGIKAIKGCAGMVMAQEPRSAKYAGMPASAIATGQVDYILPAEQMAAQLVSYAAGSYLNPKYRSREAPVIPEQPLQQIFLALRDRTGNDFSNYKISTVRRRIERRMNLHQIVEHSQYARYLEENPAEIDALFKELLINVTDFFRDKEAWSALSRELDSLVKNHTQDSLRAWVPGCATGEEAYSLAIALSESMRNTGCKHDVQVFGTDLDQSSIAIARAGRYPMGIAAELPEQIMERYFSKEDDTYYINNEIRDMLVFAPHNLVKDPPFTRLDILSCRNLLIYLNAELQKQLIPLFQYSLKPGGLLFLGSSESVGSFSELFTPVDVRWKIFRRSSIEPRLKMLPQWPKLTAGTSTSKPPTSRAKQVSTAALIEHMLLERYAPCSILVNTRGEILYIHGHTGAYLEPSQGEPRNNILEMARDGLKMALTSALRECAKKETDIIRNNLAIQSNNSYSYTDLSVSFLHQPEALRGLLLVVLVPTKSGSDKLAADVDGRVNTPKQADASTHVSQLERELEYLNQSYQIIVEAMETSTEDLKSANEELQSTNEELQSTNEELETSKEEMQSLNEELITVNAELQSKLDELSRANDDMLNLLNSTDIATIFLDRELRIQRYTEQVKDLVMIRDTDIGRPISELAFNLDINDLTADCVQVLKTLAFKEYKVSKKVPDHNTYLLRIIPYRTTNNVIDGLVLTFVNIDRLAKQQEAAD